MLRSLFTIALLVGLSSITHGEPIQVISWNIESGGAEPATIAAQLKALPTVDAYLLQEVSARDIGRLAAAVREAHGKQFKYYLSSLGGGDRLAIIFDESKYQVRSFQELFSHADYRLNDWRHRSPLVAHLKRMSDSQEFFLVTVHLARGNADLRTEQAAGLREWASSQELPVILAGDCNFDFDFRTMTGNDAYIAFFKNDHFHLAKQEAWIDTNWSDDNGDGQDDYPDSALDFGAICSNGSRVKATAKVIVRPGDFPDTKATSDHRPILVTVQLASEPLPATPPAKRLREAVPTTR